MESRPTQPKQTSDNQPRTRTSIVVTARSATGDLLVDELVEVVLPPGPVRQRDQLVRTVTDRFPDARLQRVGDGVAVFVCGGSVVTAAYAQPAKRLQAA
jgi:hypothetical protein